MQLTYWAVTAQWLCTAYEHNDAVGHNFGKVQHMDPSFDQPRVIASSVACGMACSCFVLTALVSMTQQAADSCYALHTDAVAQRETVELQGGRNNQAPVKGEGGNKQKVLAEAIQLLHHRLIADPGVRNLSPKCSSKLHNPRTARECFALMTVVSKSYDLQHTSMLTFVHI